METTVHGTVFELSMNKELYIYIYIYIYIYSLEYLLSDPLQKNIVDT